MCTLHVQVVDPENFIHSGTEGHGIFRVAKKI